MSNVIVCPECSMPIGKVTGKVDPNGGLVFTALCGHVLTRDMARAAQDAGRPVWLEQVTGATLISAERARQHTDEGYTAEHDARHSNALAWASWCYLDLVASPPAAGEADRPPLQWPWRAADWKPGRTPIRLLVIAGALIAAEIDRRLALGETP